MYTSKLFLIELLENPIPGRVEAMNWGFALFCVCFFIIAYFLSVKPRFLLSMSDNLFRVKERHSIFYETVDFGFFDRALLISQTLLLISLAYFSFLIHQFPEIDESTRFLLTNIGVTFSLLLAYVLYKYFAYNLVNWVFFRKEQIVQWNSNFLSLIELEGFVLFFPVLILFFIPGLYLISLCFVIFTLIIGFLVHLFTIYRIFFQKNSSLLYFILYLCAQEMIPLFVLFKGLVYFLKM